MELFVEQGSIVRKIWSNADTILFIFAGASAEFALNKAVDWLYFTGKLPADPLGRLFSTVTYAQRINFSTLKDANFAIDQITAIHSAVEKNRGSQIPDWAYRDVLFLLVDYSVRAYELLYNKLSSAEKEEIYHTFYRMGLRMKIPDLPENYQNWLPVRENHLRRNLEKSRFTVDLYKQYRKHLGLPRFILLKEVQAQLVPGYVRQLLGLKDIFLLKLIVPMYKLSRKLKLDGLVKAAILPRDYQPQIKALERSVN
ncbi:oxygenase MpaB family protein [Mucilaginibacter sp.]|uniref:oxygenase MpaB family protein n=1 Tax=Mucilaginibacter sp. TaxID=1882438 RepID=UPI003B000A72